jgi:predicted DNA-binding protein
MAQDVPTIPNIRRYVSYEIVKRLYAAMDAYAQGDYPKFYRLTSALTTWLWRYLSPEDRQTIKEKIEEYVGEIEDIKKKAMSPADAELQLRDKYREAGELLYSYIVLAVQHSPLIEIEIDSNILAGVDTIEDLRKIGEALRKVKKTVEYKEPVEDMEGVEG